MTFFRGLLAGPGSLVLVVGGFLVAVLRAFPGAGGRAGNWDERKGAGWTRSEYWTSRGTPGTFPRCDTGALSGCGLVFNTQARALGAGVVKPAFRRPKPCQRVDMQRSKPSAYRAFRAASHAAPLPRNMWTTAQNPPSAFRAAARAGSLRRLRPYQRCTCGSCPACRSNAKWDRIFAKFEVKEYRDVRVTFRSALEDL